MTTDSADKPLPIGRIQNEVEHRLQANPHYAYARRLGQLTPLAVYVAADDAHRRFLIRMHECGNTIGGVKPALLNPLCGWKACLVDEPSEAYAGSR